MKIVRHGLYVFVVSALTGYAGVSFGEPQKTPITMPAIKYVVPADPGIFLLPHSHSYMAYIETIGFRHGILRQGRGFYDRLVIRKVGDNVIEIERREDNGPVGSGRVYRVNFTTQRATDSYTLTLQPVETRSYQQGLFGKFPVPKLTEQELRSHILLGASIDSRFEVNSPYSGESVYANFSRTLRMAPPPMTLSGLLSAASQNTGPYQKRSVGSQWSAVEQGRDKSSYPPSRHRRARSISNCWMASGGTSKIVSQ